MKYQFIVLFILSSFIFIRPNIGYSITILDSIQYIDKNNLKVSNQETNQVFHQIVNSSLQEDLSKYESMLTVTWDGEGATDNWSEAKNWDNDIVPNGGDDVILNGADVVVDGDFQVRSASINGGEFLITAGNTLEVIGVTAPGNITIMDNNVFVVIGDLLVSGTFHISNSTLSIQGSINPTVGTASSHFHFGEDNANYTHTGTIGLHTFTNSGIFINNGIIVSDVTNLERLTNNQLIRGKINNIDKLINNGTILIFDEAAQLGVLNNSGSLENHASIVIDEISTDMFTSIFHAGIYNDGMFENEPGSNINISNISGNYRSYGIYLHDDGQFTNRGTIDIDNVEDKGLVVASSGDINFGTINIKNISKPYTQGMHIYVGDIGVGSTSGPRDFRNDGDITFENLNFQGIFLENDHTFTNNGNLNFINTSMALDLVHTPFNQIDNHLVNSNSGVIYLEAEGIGVLNKGIFAHVVNHGLINTQGNFSTTLEGRLENYGEINSVGKIEVQNINNKPTGVINSSTITLKYEDNTFYGDSFNEGKIFSGFFLQAQDQNQNLVNLPCGFIKGFFQIDAGNIIDNQGVMQAGVFQLNDSLFNTGVIVSIAQDYTSDPEFYNNGIYIPEILGNHACGDMILGVSSGSNVASIPPPSLSTDESGNISAGNYDLPAHKILLAPTVNEVDTLYAHFEMSGGCVTTAPIFFENQITCTITCEDRNWNGSISSDWHTAENWTPIGVPLICESVVIPAGSNCIIFSGNTGYCNLLEVEPNAEFNVDGELETNN